MPKLRIEEAAARRQARVDRGEEVIVGVNKYRLERPRARRRPRHRQHRRCARQQIARLEQVRADARRRRACQAALDGAAPRAPRGDGNLLALCIDAARARATVGEMSDAHGAGVRPPPGRDPYASPACTARPTRATRASTRIQAEVDGVRRGRGPPARACWSPRWARTATTAAPR